MIYRSHIGIFTQIWSQLMDMIVMMRYITYVFSMASLSGNANLVPLFIQYVINVVRTILALLFIDRWGRRTPLLIGSILQSSILYACRVRLLLCQLHPIGLSTSLFPTLCTGHLRTSNGKSLGF